MRYTRLELKKNGLSKFELCILYFILIIPIVSIMVGWAITNFIILPKYSIKNNGVNTIAINKANKVYLLQVGVFTNETNAKSMVQELNKIGIYGHYYKDNDIYRVITDVSSDLSSIQIKKLELEKKCINSMIKQLDIKYKNDEQVEKTKDNINKLIIAQILVKDGQVSQEHFNQMLKEFYNKYKDDNKINDVINILTDYQEAIKSNNQDKVIYYIVKSMNYYNVVQTKY